MKRRRPYRPVTDQERDEILVLLREGKTTGQIAKQFKRSKDTVSRIGRAAGLDLGRPNVKKAAEATRADNAARRAELARLLLEDAHRLRKQLWEPVLVYNFGGRDNTYAEHTLPEPDFAGKRALLTAIGIAVDKALALDKYDTDPQGLSEIDRWLDAMMGGADDGDSP